MAYIKAGGDISAGGNITVIGNSQEEYKPFEQCNVDELKAARLHHLKHAQAERSRINRIAFGILAVAIGVGIILAVWWQLLGDFNNSMFMVGLLGVMLPVALAIQVGNRRSDFELRQLNTVKYIETLLRERG